MRHLDICGGIRFQDRANSSQVLLPSAMTSLPFQDICPGQYKEVFLSWLCISKKRHLLNLVMREMYATDKGNVYIFLSLGK